MSNIDILEEFDQFANEVRVINEGSVINKVNVNVSNLARLWQTGMHFYQRKASML